MDAESLLGLLHIEQQGAASSGHGARSAEPLHSASRSAPLRPIE